MGLNVSLYRKPKIRTLLIQSDNRVGYLKWEPCQKLRGLRGTHLGNVPPATDPPAIPLMPFSRQALCCHFIPGHQGAPVTALGATLTPTEENPTPHLSRYYYLTPAHLFSPLYCLRKYSCAIKNKRNKKRGQTKEQTACEPWQAYIYTK